mmetsp:Transcript_46099/g.139753  ORF Transcript_46099/g.139753 Transcript_46099/m.139753 type:complete len:197 (-) Transcript_46099:54-644(-)
MVKFLPQLRTIRTAGDVPSDLIEKQRTIRARVVAVCDGDTLRVRHMPFMRSGKWIEKKLRDDTILVRIAAIDAPEVAHFGKKGQPFGKEATAFAEGLVQGKVVHLKLLARDQYGRVVAMVYYQSVRLFPPSLRANLSLEMLRNGFAVLYRQGGVAYDGMKDEFERVEAEAKKAKRGLWKQSKIQLPSEYKAGAKVK